MPGNLRNIGPEQQWTANTHTSTRMNPIFRVLQEDPAHTGMCARGHKSRFHRAEHTCMNVVIGTARASSSFTLIA
eukprot:120291-Amphidinium_carterae.1